MTWFFYWLFFYLPDIYLLIVLFLMVLRSLADQV